MSTFNEIKFDIIDTIRNKYNSDDTIEEDHVAYLIRIQRALWLRNKIREFVFIPEDAKQRIGCLEIIDAPSYECCDLILPDDCTLKRTKQKLPRFINLINKPAVLKVGSIFINEQIGIQYVARNRAPYVGLGRFNKTLLYSFLLDGYMYVVNGDCAKMTLKNISVEGVFADPSKVSALINCEGESCYDEFNDEYPVPDYLLPFMKDQVINQLLKKLQIPQDANNDSTNLIK